VSVAVVCLAVVVVDALFDAPPVIAIVFGGGAGYLISRFVSRFIRLSGQCEDKYNGGQITEPRWLSLWFVALCAFYFLVGLALVESICCVVALVVFFIMAERYNRARATGRN
jgi:hypothetical protein